MERALRLGTRGSALALAQARAVAAALEGLGAAVEIVAIRTAGDAGPSDRRGRRAAPAGGDKSRFVAEIDAALVAGEVDLAVHSAKDVPGALAAGVAIAGVPARADARDALCVGPHVESSAVAGRDADDPAGGAALARLPEGAVVGTASPRRRAQALAARPDLELRELRGNVDTRLGKVEEGLYDAAILAVAGLARLGRLDGGEPPERTDPRPRPARTPASARAATAVAALPLEVAVPAAGQGCLALCARAGDEEARALAERLTDPAAAAALAAERALTVALGADCHSCVGAHASLAGGELALRSFVGAPDGATWIRDVAHGPAADPAALGRAAAGRLLASGARDLLTG